MITFTETFSLSTKGYGDTHDLTPRVRDAVLRSGVGDGLCALFVPGSTAGLTTIEFEPGVLEDLRDAIEKIAPSDAQYRHNERWGDGNGFSHVRAAMLGHSLTVPVTEGGLVLGTWQQIVLVDFDNGPRNRKVHVKILGTG